MILGTYEKQPGERKDYDIDFSPWLPSGDTLDVVATTVTCITDPADTALVCEPIPPMTTTTVKLWVRGGTAGARYKLTVRITTVIGRIDESELIFKIKER